MEQLPARRKLVTRTVAPTLGPAGQGVIPHMEEDGQDPAGAESMLGNPDHAHFLTRFLHANRFPLRLKTLQTGYALTYFWMRQFSVSATKISSRGDTAM